MILLLLFLNTVLALRSVELYDNEYTVVKFDNENKTIHYDITMSCLSHNVDLEYLDRYVFDVAIINGDGIRGLAVTKNGAIWLERRVWNTYENVNSLKIVKSRWCGNNPLYINILRLNVTDNNVKTPNLTFGMLYILAIVLCVGVLLYREHNFKN